MYFFFFIILSLVEICLYVDLNKYFSFFLSFFFLYLATLLDEANRVNLKGLPVLPYYWFRSVLYLVYAIIKKK